MWEFNKQPQVTSESTTITIVGPVNQAHSDPFKVTGCYPSMSYTVGDKSEGVPSQPLSAGAVRVVNSVLNARVSESAIRRDRNEDI